MKQARWIVGLTMAALLAGGPAVYAAEVGKDNPIDALMDWSATFGKKGAEKDAIIAQRKAERAAKRAAKHADKTVKQAGKETEKTGKNLKKALHNASN